MNPRGREAEPASLIVPDIASARPARSFRYSPRRLSLSQRISRIVYAGVFAAAVHNPMIVPPPAFAQEGPEQSNEQVIDPNQFTEPMVAGVVAEAEADTPVEDLPDTRPCSPWPPEMVEMVESFPVLDGVCFAFYTDRSQIPYDDIRQLLSVGNISGNADFDRRIAHLYAEGDISRQQLVFGAAGERARFHMVRVSLEAGLVPIPPYHSAPSWQAAYPMTPEGRAFAAASDAVVAYARSNGMNLMDITHALHRRAGEFGRSYYDDAPRIAVVWYLDPDWLRGEVWTPIREFARQWWFS